MSFPAIAIPARIPGCMVRKRGGMVIGPDGCGFDMRSPSEMEADDARRESYEAAHAPRMAVTSRIRRVAQPPDGYLPLFLFDEVCLADPVPLFAFEDVPADVTGLAVDYLSRVARGVPARDAFRVPLAGARLVGRSADAERLLAMVDGFSDRSVRAACLLCGFDAASRVFCQVGVGRFGVSFSPCERRVSGRFGVGRSCWLLVIALVIA